MRHVLSALVQNQPGVLAHVSGMLASRGVNIDSLAVGETRAPQLSPTPFALRADHPFSTPARTRPVRPEAAAELARLQPGQHLKITQLVRVGMKTWPAIVEGTFRHVDSLATGLATQRVPEDDIIVPILHFTKPNGELSSVALD